MRLWQRRTADNAGPFSSALNTEMAKRRSVGRHPPSGASPWLWC